jgi:hypothetical protein
MEHLKSIVWLLSWPALIYVTYRACLIALKMLDRSLAEESKAEL